MCAHRFTTGLPIYVLLFQTKMSYYLKVIINEFNNFVFFYSSFALPLTLFLIIVVLFLVSQADVLQDLPSVAERAMTDSTFQA